MFLSRRRILTECIFNFCRGQAQMPSTVPSGILNGVFNRHQDLDDSESLVSLPSTRKSHFQRSCIISLQREGTLPNASTSSPFLETPPQSVQENKVHCVSRSQKRNILHRAFESSGGCGKEAKSKLHSKNQGSTAVMNPRAQTCLPV